MTAILAYFRHPQYGKNRIVLFVIIIILIIGIGFALTLKTKKTVPVTEVSVIRAVAKHIDLPKDEHPMFSTVEDSSKLKNLPFFKDAKNGDAVLIYTRGKKAILYRPSSDKIIHTDTQIMK